MQDCPSCGETTLKKLLSAPVFRLKGSGWYETDFKTTNKRNVSDAPERTSGDESSAGDGAKGKADAGKNGGPSGEKREKKSDGKGAGVKQAASTAKQ